MEDSIAQLPASSTTQRVTLACTKRAREDALRAQEHELRTLRERTRREAEDAERRCKEQQQDAIRKRKEEEEAAAKAEQHKARYAELLQKAADIRERVERARHASPAASCSTEQGTRRSRAACDHDVDGAAGGADARVRRPSAPERDARLAERERRAAELASTGIGYHAQTPRRSRRPFSSRSLEVAATRSF